MGLFCRNLGLAFAARFCRYIGFYCLYIKRKILGWTLLRQSLYHTAPHCHTLQHTAAHFNTLQHTATHCNTLQHTINTRVNSSSPKPLPHYTTLPHTATHCSTLQHTATHCNTLQYTATHDKYQGELFFAKAFAQRHFQSHYITWLCKFSRVVVD